MIDFWMENFLYLLTRKWNIVQRQLSTCPEEQFQILYFARLGLLRDIPCLRCWLSNVLFGCLLLFCCSWYWSWTKIWDCCIVCMCVNVIIKYKYMSVKKLDWAHVYYVVVMIFIPQYFGEVSQKANIQLNMGLHLVVFLIMHFACCCLFQKLLCRRKQVCYWWLCVYEFQQ